MYVVYVIWESAKQIEKVQSATRHVKIHRFKQSNRHQSSLWMVTWSVFGRVIGDWTTGEDGSPFESGRLVMHSPIRELFQYRTMLLQIEMMRHSW